jgi:hypothetical protein
MSSIENSYNRPNFPFRCGRAATWGKPCPHGPNADGSCGGIAACSPRQSGDRFTCRRRPENGGPCENGPLPDGTCCLTQPPCQPRRSLRAFRFRLSIIALILVIALIGALGSSGNLFTDGAPVFKDPGQILNAHAGVIGEKGCESCHEPHKADTANFLLAAFNTTGPSLNTSGNKCLTCHVFPAMKTSVHKSENCTTCHTEHQGAIAPVSTLTDRQCHSCHKVKFETFAKSHPTFGKTFPYVRRTAINFDHTAHLDNHFKDVRFSDKAPDGRCIGCHTVTNASNSVPIKKFGEVCASCHEEQIKNRELVLMQMPELENYPVPSAQLKEACGKDLENAFEYESVSLETMNPVLAALLDVDPDDMASYQEKFTALMQNITEDGIHPLAGLIDEAEGKPSRLLSGLSPALLKSAVCNWAANQEHESDLEPTFGGWNATELALSYRATQHSDPIMLAWLNFAAQSENETLTQDILKVEGPGNCLNCHSVSETDEIRVEWEPEVGKLKAHHKYTHAPHLNVLGPGSQCETCHKLNKKADYASAFKQNDPKVFQSNFSSIKKEVCASCHNKGQVVQGCLTCHEYHEDSGFKENVMAGKLPKHN